MIVTIDDFNLADGSLANGYAMDGIRVSVQRVFDRVIGLRRAEPALFDRELRKTTITFTVARKHDTITDAELYLFTHDAQIPTSGTVKFTATLGNVRYFPNAMLTSENLTRYIGKTTFHAYTIIGGQIQSQPASYILTEGGDHILTEAGYKIETEH